MRPISLVSRRGGHDVAKAVGEPVPPPPRWYLENHGDDLTGDVTAVDAKPLPFKE